MDALYRASNAGVQIDLVVRGLCGLRPGVKGLSENIRVISIVDRFLEHSRVFHFHNGGQPEVYLSSADWMERNLERRLELFFPVLDPALKRQVLRILDRQLADDTKAWTCGPDGTYTRVRAEAPGGRARSQLQLHEDAKKQARRVKKPQAEVMFRAVTDPAKARP